MFTLQLILPLSLTLRKDKIFSFVARNRRAQALRAVFPRLTGVLFPGCTGFPPGLPGVASCSCILPAPAARRCFVPLASSTAGTLHSLPLFSGKRSAGQFLLHTCGRKKSSSASQGRLSRVGTRGVLFVHTPCGRPR